MERILFVCSGNICRSPTAEAVLRSMIEQRGLAAEFEVDSAGTGDWHVGERSDTRSREVAARRGYRLDGRARQVEPADYEQFDRILVVDRANLAIVRRARAARVAGADRSARRPRGARPVLRRPARLRVRPGPDRGRVRPVAGRAGPAPHFRIAVTGIRPESRHSYPEVLPERGCSSSATRPRRRLPGCDGWPTAAPGCPRSSGRAAPNWCSNASSQAGWTPPASRISAGCWPTCTPRARTRSAPRRARARSWSAGASWRPRPALSGTSTTCSTAACRSHVGWAWNARWPPSWSTRRPKPPARLHGDLWTGNVLADRHGRPWLIDPAAYSGHREMDLAMLELFGSVPARTLAAYEEISPLADGWRERTALWQLFPLLVHAVLFGGGYRAQAAQVAARYSR